MDELNITNQYHFMEIGRMAQMGRWDTAMLKTHKIVALLKEAEEGELLVQVKRLQQAVSRRELTGVKSALQQIAQKRAKEMR